MESSIYPLVEGQHYTIGALRAAEVQLLAERQTDQTFSSKLRLQDRKVIGWAKFRNEEWAPLKLFADGLALEDAASFCWTPSGAADFEIVLSGRTLRLQCTMAYDELDSADFKGGHLHHKEMMYSHENGFYFPGGKISEATARDVANDLATWRAGITAAITSKLTKVAYQEQQLDLLIYARGCAFDLIDYSFAEIVRPALDQIGTENWGRTFSNVYVVDAGAFTRISKKANGDVAANGV
jgi:hypothetical protein